MAQLLTVKELIKKLSLQDQDKIVIISATERLSITGLLHTIESNLISVVDDTESDHVFITNIG